MRPSHKYTRNMKKWKDETGGNELQKHTQTHTHIHSAPRQTEKLSDEMVRIITVIFIGKHSIYYLESWNCICLTSCMRLCQMNRLRRGSIIIRSQMFIRQYDYCVCLTFCIIITIFFLDVFFLFLCFFVLHFFLSLLFLSYFSAFSFVTLAHARVTHRFTVICTIYKYDSASSFARSFVRWMP